MIDEIDEPLPFKKITKSIGVSKPGYRFPNYHEVKRPVGRWHLLTCVTWYYVGFGIWSTIPIGIRFHISFDGVLFGFRYTKRDYLDGKCIYFSLFFLYIRIFWGI